MMSTAVVIPTYNGEQWVARAIESVWRQSKLPAAIVVVDDASSDGTGDVVAQLAAKSAVPICWTRLAANTGGPARPINVGVSLCNADLVAVLDQDDVFLPDRLESHCRALTEAPQAAFAFSWYGRVDSPNEVRPSKALRDSIIATGMPVDDGVIISGPKLLTLYLHYGSFIGYPAFTFRRADWERKGGVDETLRIASDYEMQCYLTTVGSGVCVPRVGYLRDEHESNLSLVCVEDTSREVAGIQRRLLTKVKVGTNWPAPSFEHQRWLLDLVRWAREQGEYREAAELIRRAIAVGGLNSMVFVAGLKLCTRIACKMLYLRRENCTVHSSARKATPVICDSRRGVVPLPPQEP